MEASNAIDAVHFSDKHKVLAVSFRLLSHSLELWRAQRQEGAAMSLITASYFSELIKKNKKKSEVLFPELVKRLIRESVYNDCFYHIPSGDDVVTSGFDCFVKNNLKENRFVPLGDSIFEFGTNKDAVKSIKKMEEDYEKRKQEKTFLGKNECTYVATTAAILDSTKKEAIARRHAKDGTFKDFWVLDANDIVEWLDSHTNICLWLLREYGQRLEDYDISLLDDEWERLADCCNPHLTPELFTAGANKNAQRLIADLTNIEKNQILMVSSDHYGRAFAFAFCVAVLFSSGNEALTDRVLVANNQSALNYIICHCEGKLVLINFNCLDEHFAADLKNTYIFFDYCGGEGIRLDLPERSEFEKAVQSFLGVDTARAYSISYEVDYNVLALRRFLAVPPSIKVPSWSKRDNKQELIPLLLLGEVRMDVPGDVDFLKTMIGEDLDTYTERLNIWAEIPDSPIGKNGSRYWISYRKECFDYLCVDLFSVKLKRLEEKLINVLLTPAPDEAANRKLVTPAQEMLVWREKLIESIIDGFVLLSEKNGMSQNHFDVMVAKVLNGIVGYPTLSSSCARYFEILSELSPSSFLDFIRKEKRDDYDGFKELLMKDGQNEFGMASYAGGIVRGFKKVMRVSRFASEAFMLLLQLSLEIPENKQIDELLSDALTPLSTLIGMTALAYPTKISLFFKTIGDSKSSKAYDFVNQIYKAGRESIVTSVRHTYRKVRSDGIKVSVSEIFDAKSRAFNWILSHQKNSNERLENLESILQNIRQMPLETVKEQLESFVSEVLKNEKNDGIKAQMIRSILKKREAILRFEDMNRLKCHVPLLEESAALLCPKSHYEKVKLVLLDDDYPLWDPIPIQSERWSEKEQALREKRGRDVLQSLTDEYGRNAFSMLIKDAFDSSYMIWGLLFEKSDDHIADLELMINLKRTVGVAAYLAKMDTDELQTVMRRFGDEAILVKCLPLEKRAFPIVENSAYEAEFWNNHHFYCKNQDEFEYLFNKFLIFAPQNLLDQFAFLIDSDLKHEIKLLECIVKMRADPRKRDLLAPDAVIELVRKMDRKYYSDQLAMLEFQLLDLFRKTDEGYPDGLKRYFWKNPKDLGLFLATLREDEEVFNKKSVGRDILFSTLFGFGGNTFIPVDFIIQKKDELASWTRVLLEQGAGKNPQICKVIRSAVILTMAKCPEIKGLDPWPIQEVADIIEALPSLEDDHEDEIARTFFCDWVNQRGVRTIENGDKEAALAAKYQRYSDYYQPTHPKTSEALALIAESLRDESMRDKERAIFGEK